MICRPGSTPHNLATRSELQPAAVDEVPAHDVPLRRPEHHLRSEPAKTAETSLLANLPATLGE